MPRFGETMPVPTEQEGVSEEAIRARAQAFFDLLENPEQTTWEKESALEQEKVYIERHIENLKKGVSQSQLQEMQARLIEGLSKDPLDQLALSYTYEQESEKLIRQAEMYDKYEGYDPGKMKVLYALMPKFGGVKKIEMNLMRDEGYFAAKLLYATSVLESYIASDEEDVKDSQRQGKEESDDRHLMSLKRALDRKNIDEATLIPTAPGKLKIFNARDQQAKRRERSTKEETRELLDALLGALDRKDMDGARTIIQSEYGRRKPYIWEQYMEDFASYFGVLAGKGETPWNLHEK